ncbi:MAG: peptide deformylase [Actinobacteria bacterium]|nr:peptide deformylase [Actinomycetota bacterium]
MLEVRQWGDPILRSQTNQVTDFGQDLQDQIARMTQIMEDAPGAGLAAPQVGSLARLFIYRVEREGPATAVINPQITWSSDEQDIELEGCLSLGAVVVAVPRPISIKVEAVNLMGEAVEIVAEGFEARVIQHEYDHLEGVMIVDHAEREERREALEFLRERASQLVGP